MVTAVRGVWVLSLALTTAYQMATATSFTLHVTTEASPFTHHLRPRLNLTSVCMRWAYLAWISMQV